MARKKKQPAGDGVPPAGEQPDKQAEGPAEVTTDQAGESHTVEQKESGECQVPTDDTGTCDHPSREEHQKNEREQLEAGLGAEQNHPDGDGAPPAGEQPGGVIVDQQALLQELYNRIHEMHAEFRRYCEQLPEMSYEIKLDELAGEVANFIERVEKTSLVAGFRRMEIDLDAMPERIQETLGELQNTVLNLYLNIYKKTIIMLCGYIEHNTENMRQDTTVIRKIRRAVDSENLPSLKRCWEQKWRPDLTMMKIRAIEFQKSQAASPARPGPNATEETLHPEGFYPPKVLALHYECSPSTMNRNLRDIHAMLGLQGDVRQNEGKRRNQPSYTYKLSAVETALRRGNSRILGSRTDSRNASRKK